MADTIYDWAGATPGALVPGANTIVGASAFGQNTNNGNRMQPDAYYSNMFLERKGFKGEDLVFAQFAEQREITKGLDTINLRKYQPLKAHIVPLVEGLAPAADRAHGKAIIAKTRQYGRFMEFTDQFEFKVADPVIEEYTMELADLANETIDMLAQAALLAEAQVFYPVASAKATKADLAAVGKADIAKAKDEKLAIPRWEDLRIIKLTMEAAKVKSINGVFVVLASPAVYFELQTDPIAEKYMNYGQTNAPISSDSIPNLYGLSIRKAPTAHTEFDATSGVTIHHTLVLGAKAFTKVQIAGSGSIQFFKKELGSAGTLDPLSQRQTIGWKLSNIGFKVTDPDAVVDYMSVPSHSEIVTGNFDYVTEKPSEIGITDAMVKALKALADISTPDLVTASTGLDAKPEALKEITGLDEKVKGQFTELTKADGTKATDAEKKVAKTNSDAKAVSTIIEAAK